MSKEKENTVDKAAADKLAADKKAADKAAAEKEAADKLAADKAAAEKEAADKLAAEKEAAEKALTPKAKKAIVELAQKELDIMDSVKADKIFKNQKGEYFSNHNLAVLSEKGIEKNVSEINRNVLELIVNGK